MTQLARAPEVEARHAAWLNLVRSACLTLTHSSPSMVRSTSLSKGFVAGDGEEMEHCVTLAQRLAEEYDLGTEIERKGSFVTLRFIRRDRQVDQDDAPIAVNYSSSVKASHGLLARLFRRQPAKQQTSGCGHPASEEVPDGHASVPAEEGMVVR